MTAPALALVAWYLVIGLFVSVLVRRQANGPDVDAVERRARRTAAQHARRVLLLQLAWAVGWLPIIAVLAFLASRHARAAARAAATADAGAADQARCRTGQG